MNKLNHNELGYVAGLFDGEGTIGYYQAKVGYSLRCKIGMTDYRPIHWLKEALGIGFITTSKRNKRRDVYEWQIKSKKDVCDFLLAITPFLLVKREQAELLTNLLLTESYPSAYRKSDKAIAERQQILERRVLVSEELKRLKVPPSLM